MARYERYATIYQDVFDSSLSWMPEVRWVWQDLLVLAGYGDTINMSRRDIAYRTKVELDVVSRAIDVLLAPDPESRSKEFEGRRLEPIDPENESAGFRLLTREMHTRQSVEERRRLKAQYQRTFRAKRRAEREVETMKVGRIVVGE